jgi:hypothetical protein
MQVVVLTDASDGIGAELAARSVADKLDGKPAGRSERLAIKALSRTHGAPQ